jgi:hypothetical protein
MAKLILGKTHRFMFVHMVENRIVVCEKKPTNFQFIRAVVVLPLFLLGEYSNIVIEQFNSMDYVTSYNRQTLEKCR